VGVATGAGAAALTGEDLEPYRRELTGYCYRLLGSAADAQDAVQETMLRAWRSDYQARSGVRTYLYRIATNVCVDLRRGQARRARPMELGPASEPVLASLGQARAESAWVSPAPTALVLPVPEDPADVVSGRESVRLAFIAALQHLPPRQRAVLVLVDVLRWSAAEVADLLGSSVAAVNSALQRARATLAAVRGAERPVTVAADQAGLLARYVAAFERYDVDALVRLLREDATLDMPPYPLWLQGPDDIAAWLLGPGAECRGSRLVATQANGQPAFAQYRPAPGGGHSAWSLLVLEVHGDRVAGMTTFLDTATLFPLFGLAASLPG
jgi:RNA polymerase sigma-70 factor (ECF subfamily)